jgi:uncharacterized metal-binding protein
MPMGVTHRMINTFMSVPFTVGLLMPPVNRPALEAACFFTGYTFATFFMNPDLDLESEGYNSWGLLRFYWWPYQKAFSHRSFFSHFPVISTVLRIIYLLWLPVLLVFMLGTAVQSATRELVFDWVPELGPYLLAAVLGMIASDTLHLILDLSSTRLKKTFGSGRKKRRATFREHHGESGSSRGRKGRRKASDSHVQGNLRGATRRR